MLKIPEFNTKKELYAFLVENKQVLISQKCSAIKCGDGFGANITVIKSGIVGKSNSEDNTNEILIKAVINTTGIMDSHGDVHIKGIWNKSLKENKRIMHLQEHKSGSFDKIISSGADLKAYVKDYSWKDLGYDAEGETQALVFESLVKNSRNSYMFNQYKNGYVDNHSVGMQYVKLELAINDKEYEKEKDFWDKHIGAVVNAKDAEAKGYFWVVSEAKAIEGSAVPNGSNTVTPTLPTSKDTEDSDAKEKDLKAFKAFLNIT